MRKSDFPGGQKSKITRFRAPLRAPFFSENIRWRCAAAQFQNANDSSSKPPASSARRVLPVQGDRAGPVARKLFGRRDRKTLIKLNRFYLFCFKLSITLDN